MAERIKRFKVREYNALMKELEQQDPTTVSQEFLERAQNIEVALDRKIRRLGARVYGETHQYYIPVLIGINAGFHNIAGVLGWGLTGLAMATDAAITAHFIDKREKQHEQLKAGIRRLSPQASRYSYLPF